MRTVLFFVVFVVFVCVCVCVFFAFFPLVACVFGQAKELQQQLVSPTYVFFSSFFLVLQFVSCVLSLCTEKD